MKFIISILLALNLFATGIFPGAEKEWAKLPQLFEHFQEHQQEADAGMNFLDFLFLHYYTEHGACGHNDLPHCCHSSSLLVFISSYSELVTFDIFVLEASFRKENYSFNYYYNLINSLFQPPQGTFF